MQVVRPAFCVDNKKNITAWGKIKKMLGFLRVAGHITAWGKILQKLQCRLFAPLFYSSTVMAVRGCFTEYARNIKNTARIMG